MTEWVPFTEEKADSYERPEGSGDPYFFGRGYRFYICNGAEQSLLNAAPRALWTNGRPGWTKRDHRYRSVLADRGQCGGHGDSSGT